MVQAQKVWTHLRRPPKVALKYRVLCGVTSAHFGQSLVRSPLTLLMEEWVAV